MSSQLTYRQIFKAASLFGGVQVITSITGIFRSKFIAIFLGPSGMGVSGLLVSTVTLIVSISSMGLNYSAIRDISKSNESGDIKKLSLTLIVFRRMIYISCLIGAFIMIGLSSWISQFTFGTKDYSLGLSLLSIMVVFNLLTNGNTALLQGTRQLNYTAKSTGIGSVLGLITSIPIYYFYGNKGIVTALIVGAMMTFLISEFYARKVRLISIRVSKTETIRLGSEMAKLGSIMVLGQIIGYLVIYYINLFIRSKGGINDVGLYQAGTMITNQSIGLVFTAMSMDYFPRLSTISQDTRKVNEMVNQQAIITVLVSCPLLILLIVFAPVFIHVLLSPKFYIISDFIRWLALGTLFTAPTVVLGYIALAKGDKKSYFLYGCVYNSFLSIIFYVSGYLLNGLNGMAVTFCLFQFFYMIFVYIRFNQLYFFSFTKSFIILFFILTLFSIGALGLTITLNKTWGYFAGGAVLCLSISYSLLKLDQLLGIKKHLREKIFKVIK